MNDLFSTHSLQVNLEKWRYFLFVHDSSLPKEKWTIVAGQFREYINGFLGILFSNIARTVLVSISTRGEAHEIYMPPDLFSPSAKDKFWKYHLSSKQKKK